MTDEPDPQEEYDEIDPKALLIEQTALLQGIYRQLKELNTDGAQGESSDSVEQVECKKCKTQLPKDERKSHGKQCFRWDSSMGEDALESRYEYLNVPTGDD